jgi:hypothetical protein
VNSFVGAFHDAVILYALALNETLAAGYNITNGKEITNRMWNRTFEGKYTFFCYFDGRKNLTNLGSGGKGRNLIIPFVRKRLILPYFNSSNVELK